MNKLMDIAVILLIIIVPILSGCSSPSKQNLQEMQGRGYQIGANLTQEQRQQMAEQRQKELSEACRDKADGDSCTITTLGGEREGTCQNREDILICTPQRLGMPNNLEEK